MKIAKKRLFATLALVSVFAFSLVQLPIAVSEELSAEVEDEALSVITDVIGLDLTSYNTELYNHNLDSPVGYGGLVLEDVAYTLETAESKTLVVCTFINQVLIHWDLVPLESSQLSPLYAQPLPTSTVEVVKDVLQRYHGYSKTSIIQEAVSTLDDVTEIKTMNVTRGTLKMLMTENCIDWVRTINGLDFPTGLSISFNNGIVDGFSDESNFYRIGSVDVNISQEEAVRVAWEETKKFTSLNIWVGDKEEIVPFHVKEEPWIVRLQVGTANLTSYPYWYVWFVADPEVYSHTGVEVSIRADTGEIAYSQPTTYYGVLVDPDTPETTTSPDTQPESDPNQPISIYVIAGTAAIAIALAIATITLKRRRK